MYRHLVIAVALIMLCIGCNQQVGKEKQSIESKDTSIGTASHISSSKHRVKEYSKFSFPTTTTDPSGMGYKTVSAGPDIGVSSILLLGGSAILVDTYFSNLKMIDLGSGNVTAVSQTVGEGIVLESAVWLGEASVFNDSIYVIGFDDIYVFDDSLNQARAIQVNRGPKEIWSKSDEFLCFHLDGIQYEDLTVEWTLLCISYMGEVMRRKELVGPDVNAKKRRENRSGGIPYQVESDSSGYFLEAQGEVYELYSDIPSVIRTDANNVAFDSDKVIFFSSNSDSLVIHYYQY